MFADATFRLRIRKSIQRPLRNRTHTQYQARTRPTLSRFAELLAPRACIPELKEDSVMSFLVIRAYLKLIHFDLYLARGNFAALYNEVRRYPVGTTAPSPEAVERICAAVDMACIWYWKEALCLQRSAAAACLLKRHGVPAQMVIGAQQMPFKAHAWVEVDGCVVNDKPHTPELYGVLHRR